MESNIIKINDYTLLKNREKFNNLIDQYIKNSKKIDCSYVYFFSFDDIDQKKLYILLDEKSNSFAKISSRFLPDLNLNKHKYLLGYEELKFFKNITENFYSNVSLLKNNHIEPYNFTRFSNINNLDNYKHIFKSYHFDNKVIKKHNKILRLGFYILPRNRSPGFNNFRAIVPHLAKHFDIYFFLDNDQSLLDSYDMKFFKDATVFNVDKLNSNQLYEKIKSMDLSLLIYIYGFYSRKDLVLKKPCNIQIHFQEPPVIYPKSCFDFNLIDIHLYDILKKYSNLDFNYYGFINLKKNFILPIPFYSDYSKTFCPNVNSDDIKIGVICYDPKICYKFIDLVNKIIQLNDKITFTFYGHIDSEWFNILFNNPKIKKDIYNNKSPDKLLTNYLLIDTINYNNHSTALEALKLKIPFIGISNYRRYNACFSQSLLKSIKMENELLVDSSSKMIKLIEKYINDKEFYLQMCNKLSNNIDKYFTYEYYSNDFVDTLNQFYESLN